MVKKTKLGFVVQNVPKESRVKMTNARSLFGLQGERINEGL